MDRWAKFWCLTRPEKKFLCEATILLSLSNVCIKAIAFRYIDRFLRARWKDGLSQNHIDCEQEIKRVRRSVSRAANLLPWQSLCLSRSIAEFIMLRRRRIPAVILAGVKFSDHSSLDAHAWVEAGGYVSDDSANVDFTTVITIGTKAINQ